jgi:hypothetical protein
MTDDTIKNLLSSRITLSESERANVLGLLNVFRRADDMDDGDSAFLLEINGMQRELLRVVLSAGIKAIDEGLVSVVDP